MTIANRSMVLESGAGHVFVTADDADRFYAFAQEAVKASQLQQSPPQILRIFQDEILAPLREWCERRTGRVKACYVPVPRGHLEAYVIGSSQQYDFKLGHESAELSLEFLDRGIHILVMPIPNSADEATFCHFDPEGAFLVYANPKSTPNQGPR